MGLKQPFNSISHMVGGGLSLLATPLLFLRVDSTLGLITSALYAFGLVSLYTLSVLFHSIPGPPRRELWLERLDHVGIYLLIAGTYSPVSLLLVGDRIGWALFLFVWLLAAIGIVLSLTVPLGPKWVHILGYIALGWAALIAAPALLARVDAAGLALLLGGGVVFTLGAVLYVRDRPRLVGPFGDHEIWHVLVIAASAMHFWFVVAYVL